MIYVLNLHVVLDHSVIQSLYLLVCLRWTSGNESAGTFACNKKKALVVLHLILFRKYSE
jgi:hypothetical protein